MRKLKNVLVEYQGGGFDGCFWEWNYAFVDCKGRFHDIFSSGSKGCTTLKELHDYMTAADASPSRHGSMYGTYRINVKADLERFADSAPVDRLVAVARWFSYNQFKRVAIEPKCTACGHRFNALSGTPEGLQGEGGIVLAHSEIVCEDCYSQHSCPDCNEYYGPDYKGWKDDEDGRACEYCAERRAKIAV
jgi:hypothetical protein